VGGQGFGRWGEVIAEPGRLIGIEAEAEGEKPKKKGIAKNRVGKEGVDELSKLLLCAP